MKTISIMGIIEDATIIPQPAGGVLHFLVTLSFSTYLLFLILFFLLSSFFHHNLNDYVSCHTFGEYNVFWFMNESVGCHLLFLLIVEAITLQTSILWTYENPSISSLYQCYCQLRYGKSLFQKNSYRFSGILFISVWHCEIIK